MEYIIYLVLSPIAFAIVFVTMTVVWRFRKENTGFALLLYFSLVLFFLVTNVFELMASQAKWMLLWTKLQISFYSLIPLAWVSFALNMTNTKRFLLKKNGLLLFIIPVVTILLVNTYPLQHFFYTGYQVHSVGSFSTLDTEYAPFFWIFGAHSYILLISGSVIILKYIFFSSMLFRKQMFLVTLGSALPLIANILYILPLPFFAHKDYTPLAFALSGLFFFIGIFWHRFLEIIPYARNIIVDEMDQGVLILDTEGIVVDANRALFNLFTLEEKIIGNNIRDIAIIWNGIMEPYRMKAQLFETSIKNGDKVFTFSVMMKPLTLNDRSHGILITFSDISLLVGLYNEKLELLRQMEDTYEKLNSTKLQLIHKEKLATIGHISAGVAHEIKNPLSFVTSNHRFVRKKMEQLEASGQCDEFRDDMNEIKEVMKDSDEGLERILAVINNLLVFSRKESDEKMDFGFDINAGLERTILILKGTIDPSLEIDKNYGNIDKIECYGGEINQVFLNLLTNAAQAVEPIHGTPGKIVIRTWEENTQVFCSIGNTGKPIESDIMEKIFDPFFTTKESGKGTGLGLSIVSDIVVKRHNGTIDVGHEKDMTVFTVALPKKRNAFTVIA